MIMMSSKKRQRSDVQTKESSFESPFTQTTLHFTASLPPSYIGRVEEGIQEILNYQLLKYDERLGGVLLSYSDVNLVEHHGTVFFELPDIQFRVTCKALLFKTRKGMTLEGVVSQVNSGHITLMACGAFQISVAKAKLPKGYKYEKAEGEWKNKGESEGPERIKTGETIKLHVVAVHNTGGLWFIEGSLLSEDKVDSPSITTPKKRKLISMDSSTHKTRESKSERKAKKDKKSKREKKSKKEKKHRKHK